ncbi:response regulator transcription factor [Alkalicoccus daliensis]|uniref:Two-component system, response regulator YesN n=1 Tax=Alkalicoccus daliensis TaxID=745820 RepID=A0A1H0GZK7_9BACI|nr:response regulator [Alkalicoccus daliensis]SDO12300.1 two-component system, response regulator YesN [Alkalicoccus daliensis]
MRHKILIVEDEVLERKALKKMIESNFSNTEVIGEASSSRQAIELVELFHPDIITMDIRLPGMDGIQTIEEIQKNYPHISFIILSAFDTFSYAKKAITLGVHDYLLKPYDEEELCTALQQVLQHREKSALQRMEHLSMKDQMEQMKLLAETELVTNLLENRISDLTSDMLQDILEIQFHEAVALRINFHQQTPFNSFTAREVHQLLKQELYHYPYCLLGPLQGGQLPVIIFRTGGEENSLKSMVQEIWKHLIPVLDKRNFTASCGAGDKVNTPELLVNSFQEAVQASLKASRPMQLVFYQQTDMLEEAKVDYRLENLIIQAVRSGNLQEASSQLSDFLTQLLPHPKLSSEDKREQIYDLFLLCSRTADPPLKWNKKVIKSCEVSLESMDVILQTFDELCRQRLDQLEDIHHNVIKATLQYLEENYQNDITLESAARQAHLTPSYLSKIVKERTGVTFIDHLTRLRISKAKELLKTTNASLKEICFSIGYHDPNYFSKVFRKYENISPREYRQQYFKDFSQDISLPK